MKLIISLNALVFSVLAFFFTPKFAPKTAAVAMPMCSATTETTGNNWSADAAFDNYKPAAATVVNFPTDPDLAYSMPTLSTVPNGEILLSWMEKDAQGISSFCFSTSKDKGKTFSDKKVIFASAGVSSSRLFRAKLMVKKDGSLVAVFANRNTPPPTQQPANGQPQANNAPQQGGGGGRGGRSMALVFTTSKDGGSTWTTPQAVDSDPSAGMRGFFDAILLANDEVAVAYLKDVKGSTKHEERDLRLVLTKNGVFQPETLLDAVVCDCCNINLLVDANGHLNVFYRDNNDDIRDIAKMVSKDNGATFSKSEIVHNDGWKIAGCPHSGATSTTHGKGSLVAWYSGSDKESGVRLVTQDGKKLMVLNDPSVKNPAVMSAGQVGAMLWEQGKEQTQLVFRKVKGTELQETKTVEGSTDATNSTGLIVGNQMLIAHEVKMANKKNGLKISTVSLLN